MLWDARWFLGRAASWPKAPSERDAILRHAPPPTIQRQQAAESTASHTQLMLALAASLGYLSIGLVRGFSSPGVPSMRALEPHLLPSTEAASWVSSIPPLLAMVGSLVAGPLLQRVGRKRTLVLSAPLATSAWLLLAFAPDLPSLLAARALTGFCAGITIPSAQVYVSECSHPRIRGVLGSLPALFMSAGILVAYVLGAWWPWRILAGASAVFPGALLLLLLPLPESPAWLADRGRSTEAARALRWLRRPPLEDVPLKDLPQTSSPAPPPPAFSREALFRKPVLLPFALSLLLMIFQQLSGIDSIVFYTVDIFHAAGSSVEDHLAAILVGAVQLGSNVVALFVVDRAGRRPLLLVSGGLMATSMAALGAYFHLLSLGRAQGLGLLPLLSLLVFMIGFSVGYCTLPYLMMGEILPVQQRSFLSSLAGSFNLGIMFVVIKTFHNLSEVIGNDGVFWLYAAMCVCSCGFVAVFVPETKGKSLEEIQEYFEEKHASQKTKQEENTANSTQDQSVESTEVIQSVAESSLNNTS